MTIYLPALVGIVASVVTFVALQIGGYVVPGIVFPLIAVPVMLLYHYSPLPDDNGTVWGREPYMQEWGFTTEPRDGDSE